MKKLLLLIASLSSSSVIAMDPTTPRSAHPERARRVEGLRDTNHAISPRSSLGVAGAPEEQPGIDQPYLKEDLNAQDQHGNTPLQNTVIAWQKSNASVQEKAAEYTKLNTQYKRIQQEITRELLKNRANNNALVVLDAKRQTVLEMVNIVRAELASFQQQADQHKKTAIQLIQSGACVNIPHLNREAALKWELVYAPLQQAIIDGDMPTIEKYLQIGANPDFKNPDGRNGLAQSIDRNNPEVAKRLLFGGAKLTSIVSFAGGTTVSILLLAAHRATYNMVQTLLESPQASPSVYSSSHNLKKIQQEMFTFLCCMNRKKTTESLELPGEVIHHMCKFLLPDETKLIDQVSLEQLPHYLSLKVQGKMVLNKASLINALTERHMVFLSRVLTTKSYITIENQTKVLPPHRFPRCREFNGLDLSTDTEAVKSALDPANLEQHRAAIAAHYTKLLE